MNMDMIKTWLDDFSQWSKIIGGLGKMFGEKGVFAGPENPLSSAWNFLTEGGFSTAFESLSSKKES